MPELNFAIGLNKFYDSETDDTYLFAEYREGEKDWYFEYYKIVVDEFNRAESTTLIPPF